MGTVQQSFELATAYHKGGNLSSAEPLYKQVIAVDPNHAGAHHLLGLLEYQMGRSAMAIPLIRRAIALNPNIAAFHVNLGIALLEQGLLSEAAASQRRALRLEPRRADALSNLALALRAMGEFADAAQCCREALTIDPRHIHALNVLGNICLDQKRPTEAADFYRQALSVQPLFVDALTNLGLALKEQGQPAEALEWCRQAVDLNPNNAHALHNLGLVHKDLGHLDEAAACYRAVLQIDPDYIYAHINLGNVFMDQLQFAEASLLFQEALRRDAKNTFALNNLGIALERQGRIDEAIETSHQVLRLDPHNADARNNLGASLAVLGKLAEALEQYDKALEINAGFEKALWNRSLLWLLKADFDKGWPDYEYRRCQPEFAPRHKNRPSWDGSYFVGKTLLIHAEQGLGDTIQFARYIRLVKQRGGTVLFECPRSLMGLLASISGVDQLIPTGAPVPPFDIQTPLLSLPGLFGTRLETIPADVPYLKVNPERVEYWQKILGSVKGFKIGIAWQGNPQFRSDRYRSIPLKQFEPLARIEGVSLVSMQVGTGRQQLTAIQFPVLDLGVQFDMNSLEDLAGALLNLDLVITSDTAVAHLAGALAVPVWIALHFSPDWRWLLKREDSPWYPTMHLFRQHTLGDWTDVFARIAAALRDETGSATMPA